MSMTSHMSRFIRLLMATLILSVAVARPAVAQDATVLRDSET